jgi:galactoside 2-L-fucosyltransferase 1/2
MFVHAALLGLSQSVGCRPAVMAAENRMLLSVFQLSTSVVIKTSSFQRHIPVRQLPFASRVSVYVPLNLSAADRKRIVDNGEYVQVTSYFQSWRYFADVEERVRTDFRFQTRVANAVERIVRRLDVMVNSSTSVAATNYSSLSPWTNTTQPEVVRVGIHVRRSDMASENHLRRGYTVADESYIRRAMSLMEERLLHYVDGRRPRSLVYVVATDDEAWARVYVRSSRFPVVFVAQLSAAAGINHDAAVDLAVLAACNHTITTVGTFGWWAAFLAGGLTIYDATFPAPNTEIASDFRAEDYYPPHWIGLR